MAFMNFYKEFLKTSDKSFKREPRQIATEVTDVLPVGRKAASKGKKAKDGESAAAAAVKFENCENMEHSYSRDCRPIEGANGLTTRTLMIHRPPPCPSCHPHPIDDSHDLGEANNPPIPTYNETAAKEAMNECIRVAKNVKNSNPDDDDWEERVNRTSWSHLQNQIFKKIVQVLDCDQLARLATVGKQHEPVHKRVIIDKSAQRMRKILASINWDSRVTQWLHGVLVESLPPTYMASYLDILQTLKSKVGSLVEKMVFRQAMNLNQGLLDPVLENQWEPIVSQKQLKLPQNTALVVIPPNPTTGILPSRVKKWYQLLSTMAQITQVNMPVGGNTLNKQPLDQLAEQIVSLARLKIKDLRNDNPQRPIVLVGFNAGAALALQVAMVEQVSSVVCMGFAYNTINGVRGSPDDHILDIKIPILFIIGQNSARTSQEEMEAIRERMHSETSLVVIGSADDVLRVPKSKRKIEGVTQSMVDNMVMDEIHEFVKKCIVSPPGPRQPNNNLVNPCISSAAQNKKSTSTTAASRKRKTSQDEAETKPKLAKNSPASQLIIGRPRTRPLPVAAPVATPIKQTQTISQPTNEDLNMAIQSILGESDLVTEDHTPDTKDTNIITYEIVGQQQKTKHVLTKSGVTAPGTKIKMIPANQFVQLKPPIQSQSKIYTIKTTSMGSGASPSTTVASEKTPQYFTLKTTPSGGTQFVSTPQNSNQFVMNSHKFKILKSGTTIISGGKTTTTDTPVKTQTLQTTDFTNIIDMPIIFADSEGNIQDAAASPVVATTSSTSGQFIIKHKDLPVTPKSNFIIKQATTKTTTLPQTSTPNKVVFINRNTMKPCPRIISKSTIAQNNYSKFVVANPKASVPSLVQRAQGVTITELPSTSDKPSIVSAVKQFNLQPTKTIVRTPPQGTAGILNVSPVNKGTYQQPILINVDSDKLPKNIIKIGDQPKPTIYLSKAGLKSIPVVKSNTFINRNVTVRKMVNIVPTSKTTINKLQPTTISTAMSTSALLSTLTGNPMLETPKTSEPKILTITTSAVTAPSNTPTTSSVVILEK